MDAQQIASTAGFRPEEAHRVASALDGASQFEPAVWAMIKAGCYSVDEIVERIQSLRFCAK